MSGNQLERVTVTLPAKLVRQVEQRMDLGMFASLSEWIRHAIREQLQRERTPLEIMIEEDPRILDSMSDLEKGNLSEVDLNDWKRRAGG